MHHGGEGLYRLVCFQYSFPAPASHSKNVSYLSNLHLGSVHNLFHTNVLEYFIHMYNASNKHATYMTYVSHHIFNLIEKNIYGKYTTFRREKWKKYIFPHRQMYVKYIFVNIFHIYKENIL